MVSAECPKCRSRMDEGFIKDDTYGAVHASKWVEGPPEKSFWTGTKTRGKKLVQVTTFRCTKCGFLESYATDRGRE
jgi:predicted nucleic-acid-binding Zn-ribbon protein